MSLSKRSVDPAYRGRRDWADKRKTSKWDVLELALQTNIKDTTESRRTDYEKD